MLIGRRIYKLKPFLVVPQRAISISVPFHQSNNIIKFSDNIENIFQNNAVSKLIQQIPSSLSHIWHSIENQANLWDGILFSSTMKKRRAKMNKHKLRKRNKKMRFNTKSSRR